jgi:hypothetical protein
MLTLPSRATSWRWFRSPAIVFAFVAGCGDSTRHQVAADTDSAHPSAGPLASSLPAQESDTSPQPSKCPGTGLWALCSVEKRLGQAGFVVTRADSPAPRRPGFSVPPAAYTLGRGKLEVFVYPDARSLARDWSQLDTTSASPRGKVTAWGIPPTLVRSANLAAVYLTDSPVQAERLSLALTAGPPQPPQARPARQQVLPTVEVRPRK